MDKSGSHYQILKQYLFDEVVESLKNIRVVSYVFVSVLLIGGAGVWMPWMRGGAEHFLPGSNVFTYVFALLGTLLCNRLYFNVHRFQKIRGIVKNKKIAENSVFEIESIIEEFDKESILSSWGMLFGSIILLIVSYSYAYHYDTDSVASLVALLLSIVFYLASTAMDINKKTDPNGDTIKDRQDSKPPIPILDELDDINEDDLNSSFFQSGE